MLASLPRLTRLRVAAPLLAAAALCLVACEGYDGYDDNIGRSGSGGGGSGGRGGRGGASAAGSGGQAGAAMAGRGGSGGRAGAGGRGGAGGAGNGALDDGGVSNEPDVESQAADLRVDWNVLLGEHLTLTAKASAAAVGGRTDERSAYTARLEENANRLRDQVSAAFGGEVGDAWLDLWTDHNGWIADYASALAVSNTVARDGAFQKLREMYAPRLGELLAPQVGETPAALEAIANEHLDATLVIIDTQAAQDWPNVFVHYRAAFARTQSLADVISVGTAEQLPRRYPGDPEADTATLRVGMNAVLQEHAYLATFASGALPGGDPRQVEFEVAATALADNGSVLGLLVANFVTQAAADEFTALWLSHNLALMEYAMGKNEPDAAKSDAALETLTDTYVPQLATLLHDATALPETMLRSLNAEHVSGMRVVIDAQAAGKPGDASQADVNAAQHMRMLGDPLSIAFAAKLTANAQTE
ncbi:MAG: hypothetical protein ABW321_02595 [Polyangiales bacterium]